MCLRKTTGVSLQFAYISIASTTIFDQQCNSQLLLSVAWWFQGGLTMNASVPLVSPTTLSDCNSSTDWRNRAKTVQMAKKKWFCWSWILISECFTSDISDQIQCWCWSDLMSKDINQSTQSLTYPYAGKHPPYWSVFKQDTESPPSHLGAALYRIKSSNYLKEEVESLKYQVLYPHILFSDWMYST